MYRFAIYGKGGIGKSTVTTALSCAFAEMGLRVLQVGCDPKADSTLYLHGGQRIDTVLDVLRQKRDSAELADLVHVGYKDIVCAEAGGPTPGLGCAGRGIAAAFEALEARDAFDIIQPDVVLYDVLGDVVCGGFAMPIREGYAHRVYIVTSGENMAIYAAANIAMAVENFRERGYASLGGLILNRAGRACQSGNSGCGHSHGHRRRSASRECHFRCGSSRPAGVRDRTGFGLRQCRSGSGAQNAGGL